MCQLRPSCRMRARPTWLANVRPWRQSWAPCCNNAVGPFVAAWSSCTAMLQLLCCTHRLPCSFIESTNGRPGSRNCWQTWQWSTVKASADSKEMHWEFFIMVKKKNWSGYHFVISLNVLPKPLFDSSNVMSNSLLTLKAVVWQTIAGGGKGSSNLQGCTQYHNVITNIITLLR